MKNALFSGSKKNKNALFVELNLKTKLDPCQITIILAQSQSNNKR